MDSLLCLVSVNDVVCLRRFLNLDSDGGRFSGSCQDTTSQCRLSVDVDGCERLEVRERKAAREKEREKDRRKAVAGCKAMFERLDEKKTEEYSTATVSSVDDSLLRTRHLYTSREGEGEEEE